MLRMLYLIRVFSKRISKISENREIIYAANV